MSPPLGPEEWERLSPLLDAALEQPPEMQARFVREACAGDQRLQELLMQLLQAARDSEGRLERAVLDRAGTILHLVAAEDPAVAEPRLEQVGPWRVMRELGRGGMGVVYLAERADGQYEQQVALKLVKRGLDTDEILARFVRERQILARLEHPCIARLIEGGLAEDGRPYIAMEYVQGEAITSWCEANDLGVEARLALFLHACDAVQHAHRNLVIHRDLKPSNILVTAGGHVKLLDFGIAHLLASAEAEEAATLASPGQRVLTPDYAAPEQVRGEPATTATDVYGLGMVLYEMLAGQRPYRITSREVPDIEKELRTVQLEAPSRRAPAKRARRLRGDLDTIVLTALRREPERRYPSAEALALDVRRYLDRMPIVARGDSPGYRASRFVSRHRAAVGVSALLLVSLVAGLAGTLWQWRAAQRAAIEAGTVKDFLVSIFEISDPSQSRGAQVPARELLDRAAARIEHELAAEPAVKGEMVATMAAVYEKLGLMDAARPLAEQALSLARQQPGEQHAVPARARMLGRILTAGGSYDAAAPLLAEALEADRIARAGRDIAEDLDALAILERARGKLDDAEQHTREALDLRRRLEGPEHADIATSLNNLAVMLREKGKLDEAEPLYRESLAMRRKLLGEDHPDVAVSLNNLSALLRQRGRLEEAERVAREALALNRKLYGEENLNTITSLNNLAAIVQSLARYDEAEQLNRAVLAFWRRTQGDKHPNALVSLNNLASVLRDKGELDEAEALFRQLLATWPEVVGPKHPFVAVTTTHLAALLSEKGSYDEAQALLDQALALRRALHGEEHPEVATVLYHLGILDQRRGRLPQAEETLRRVVTMREKTLAADHPQTAQARLALGSVLREEGRPAEAYDLQAPAAEILRKFYGPDHPEAATAALEIGRTLAALGRPDEARASLAQALARRQELFGEASPRTAQARAALDSIGSHSKHR